MFLNKINSSAATTAAIGTVQVRTSNFLLQWAKQANKHADMMFCGLLLNGLYKVPVHVIVNGIMVMDHPPAHVVGGKALMRNRI